MGFAPGRCPGSAASGWSELLGIRRPGARVEVRVDRAGARLVGWYIWRRESSDDVSLVMYLLFLGGQTVYLPYFRTPPKA